MVHRKIFLSLVAVVVFVLSSNLYAKSGDFPKKNQGSLFSNIVSRNNNAYTGNSGNNPYESLTSFPDDSVFIKDTGDDLDKYLFRDDVLDGKLSISLPISRFFGEVDANGKLRNLQRMIDRGIIKKDAKLLINVFDVDDDYQGTDVAPEKDIVLFNGKKQKNSLSSGDNIWSTRSYSIPVGDIKFPQNPNGGNLNPADNTIEILIDTANQDIIWATEIDWIALVIDGINPIVLIHGHGGGPGTWQPEFEGWLTTDNTPYYLPNRNETLKHGDINTNATNVGRIVERVKTMYGVNKVNLVTHSRGGVDSRIYIRRGNANNVNALIQLSAPNHGAGIGAFGGTSDSADDLQRGHFRDRYNYQKIHIPVSGWSNDEDKFVPMYTADRSVPIRITIGDSDWVVDTKSATFPWTPECKDKQDVIASKCPNIFVKSKDINGETTWPKSTNVDRIAAGLDHGDTHDNQATYNWVIEQIKNLTKSIDTFKMKNKYVSTMIEDEGTALILSDNYSIGLNGNNVHAFNIGSTTKIYFQISFPLSTQLNSKLTDSNGNTHVALGEQQTDFGVIRRYTIDNPIVGEWNLQIQSASGVNYFIEVWQVESGVKFSGGSEKSNYTLSETINFFAYLKDGTNVIPGAIVSAKITSPDGNDFQLMLHDDATHSDQIANDGIYTNTYNSNTTGLYQYSVSAQGNQIQRQVNGEFTIIDNNSVFTDQYSDSKEDKDGDGFADILKVNVGVDFKKVGDYEIIGSLNDTNGNLIETVLTPVNVTNLGKQNITLNFNGNLIYNHGINGSFELTDLMLRYKVDNVFTLIDYRETAYKTAFYSSKDEFEQPLIIMTNNGNDQGVDADLDSFFDSLRVTLELEIVKPGDYQIMARLVNANGKEIDWADKIVTLIKGVNSVFLDFNGQKIRQSQTDGPYMVKDLLIIGQGLRGGASLSSIDAYSTGTYNFIQFQPIPTDLEINSENITFSNDTPKTGENIQITVILNNNGEATAESITVKFFEGNPLGSGTQIGNDHIVDGLAENASSAIIENWSSITEGEKSIYITANQNRSISEFDYSNNSASKILTVSNTINPIPTISEWGTITLAFIFVFSALFAIRKERKKIF